MMAAPQRKRLFVIRWAMVSLVMFLLVACGTATPPPSQPPLAITQVSKAHTIVIGDVDPDEPVKKIRRFQPLADYLASRLRDFQIQAGRVLIAQNFEEMGKLLKNGEVDIYFDSLFPAIVSQDIPGSEFFLRRSKNGVSEYWSTFVVLKERMVDSFDAFLGEVVAFEEPRSTSGYVLPAGELLVGRYSLIEVAGPSADVGTAGLVIFSPEMKKTP